MGIQAEEYRPSAVLEHELGAILGDATIPIKDDPAESSLLLRVATTMRWRRNAETVLMLIATLVTTYSLTCPSPPPHPIIERTRVQCSSGKMVRWKLFLACG